MARIDYNYSCGACDPDHINCSYTILSDGVQVHSGTQQFACGVTEADKRATIVSFHPYETTDTAYANGTQFYPANNPTHKSCVNNICTSVSGSGTDTCTTISAACTTTPPSSPSSSILLILAAAAAAILLLRKK